MSKLNLFIKRIRIRFSNASQDSGLTSIVTGHHRLQVISSFARPMSTKLGRVLTYDEGKPWKKSYDPLMTWSLEVT